MSDLKPITRPIQHDESDTFHIRLKEAIGTESIASFARKISVSDSLLGSYVRGEKSPGLEKLVAISRFSGVTIDWLATGRLPKYRREVGTLKQSQTEHLEALKLAVEVVQEWQIEHQKFLPADKFMGVVELLAEDTFEDQEKFKKQAVRMLRLVA